MQGLLPCVGLLFFASGTQAQEPVSPSTLMKGEQALTTTEDIKAYWTPDRMKNAIPIPMVTSPDDAAFTEVMGSSLSPDMKPGYAPGWNPKSGLPMPDPRTRIEITSDQPPYSAGAGSGTTMATSEGINQAGTQPQHGTTISSGPGSPTDYAGYAPFQRTAFAGRYLTFPRSTIGKIFFSQDANGNGVISTLENFVCSGSVIALNTVATAGHCMHNGLGDPTDFFGGFSTNILFCPSYNAGGINPNSGCWSGAGQWETGQWYTSSNFDRDYSCFITAATGTIVNNRIGNFTGTTGRAWNWNNRQHVYAFGYPAGAPFNGTRIIVATSTETYTRDTTSGDGQVSKYIGNDMTGGSSGGPWWLNFQNQNISYPDVDGSDITNPFQGSGSGRVPYINGVNSHRRTGYLSEIGSPEFHSGASGDNTESEDIFSLCFNNGGT